MQHQADGRKMSPENARSHCNLHDSLYGLISGKCSSGELPHASHEEEAHEEEAREEEKGEERNYPIDVPGSFRGTDHKSCPTKLAGVRALVKRPKHVSACVPRNNGMVSMYYEV